MKNIFAMLGHRTHAGAAHRLQLSRGRDEVRGALELLLGRCEDSCFCACGGFGREIGGPCGRSEVLQTPTPIHKSWIEQPCGFTFQTPIPTTRRAVISIAWERRENRSAVFQMHTIYATFV